MEIALDKEMLLMEASEKSSTASSAESSNVSNEAGCIS